MAKHRIIKELTLKEVERLAFRLAQKHLDFDAPIPDFSSRYPNVLEGCLQAPFQKVFKKHTYPTFIEKAAMLFYLLIKDHPFRDGNKRIAIMVLSVFLQKNDKMLEVDTRLLYELTVRVAGSSARDKELTVLTICGFIWKYLKDLKPTPLFD